MLKKLAYLALLSCALAGCNKTASVPAAAVPAPSGPNLTVQPDVGKIEQVSVTATGMGITPGAAINDALKTAVMQVNGATVQTTSGSLQTFSKITAELDIETADKADHVRASSTVQGGHFAEQIISKSQGVVSAFKVDKLTPPPSKGGMFSADISVTIAKFKAPADSGKIKIVVAPLRSDQTSFDIGGRAVPADVVLSQLRQQLIDALSQSGRFTVLDRQFEGEMENELEMITSGKAASQEFAKLGQALTADLVYVGVVNELGYTRHARQLRTSERELVSYSGGWSVSHRMINLATRQILQSGTINGQAPSVAPTTLGSGINADAVLQDMRMEIAKRSAAAVLLQTFPVSVVQRDGVSVVLSQGGSSVAEGARYKLYLQGKEIKDPQTGLSLGNLESACCNVLVTRVTPKLSYGTLEAVTVNLDGVVPGALQVKEMLTGDAAVASSAPAAAPATAAASAMVAEPAAAIKTATVNAGGKPAVARKPAAADKSGAAKAGASADGDW